MNAYDMFNVILNSNQAIVLATIIKVEGSSYRKEGAMLLCMEDGSHVGLISGGCLERDLVEKAKIVFLDGISRTVTYNLADEDDLSWGQGSGCNGVITVLLELVDMNYKAHLKRVQQLLSEGISVQHTKYLTENGTVVKYGFSTGTESVECLEDVENTSFIFQQVFRPKPRLIIFGAGIDARPLGQFAYQSGFETIITDWRPAFCQKEFFPGATQTIVAYPNEFTKDFVYRRDDIVVIMTHNFRRDEEILAKLLKEELLYIGILGPRQRTLRLLKNQDDIERIHSPVGLPIGAVGPEEIAISIMAEIIKVVRKGEEDDNWYLSSSR
ncbi:XdhC family protein [Anaerobacillus alkaliphilus]|uniref:XdhC family protein n=1 Tax=Anaerobacillus alkaliphilus TaxID=1548597 RepID=A0A4Q0VRP5_9BACI|nr:XdhC family protein [Anaerobacillus alkaliphilus]RXJ00260.1 XdhC family protein [Anaerobacillus alkaliphilus]